MLATLAFAFMLPATLCAQSDMAPDEYAFSATEVAVAHSPCKRPSRTKQKPILKAKFRCLTPVKCGSKQT